MRTITFEEFAKLVDDATAVIIDHNAVVYPVVEDDEVIVEDDNFSVTFDEDAGSFTILDDGSIEIVMVDETFNIQVLQVKVLE